MPTIIELKSVTQAYADALATVVRILPEVLACPIYQRETIAAHLETANLGLAIQIATLCANGRGGEAIDLLASAVAALETSDAPLFAKAPVTREEALRLAIAAYDGPVSDQTRAMLWKNFCDIPDERRFKEAYRHRHLIAARGERAASIAPNRTRDGGLIDGGSIARAAVGSQE
ncbi:MAG: hypothetical protein JNL45_09300 [Hyphomicrobium sp.]|jgi:hypothetical protein|nr:hypothetical protein [Hyphomicrobium sp.]